MSVMRQTRVEEFTDNPFHICKFEGAVEAQCGDVVRMYELPLVSGTRAPRRYAAHIKTEK